MASTYLTRTQSAGNRRTWTWSAWVKRSSLTSNIYQYCFDCDNGASQSESKIGFISDQFQMNVWNGSSNDLLVGTSRLYRDTNAWYHIVFVYDSTQATASDRIKIYTNGVLETDLASTSYPSQNFETGINSANEHSIGRWQDGNNRFFDGIMSHVHFCDGYTYDASAFGETDSTTGEWKIKTDVSVTYGTNGFFILKDGNSVTDQSGNSNNFTVGGGTLTKTEDNPSNVFATCNPLHKDGGSAITFTNGNTTADVGSGNDWCTTPSTLGATSGKFYFEAKLTLNSNNEAYIGVANQGNLTVKTNVANYLGIDADSIGWYSGNGDSYYNVSASSYGNSWTTGDIVGCAIDIDNSKLYFSKNGTWQNSGDPTSGSTGTGALNLYHTAGDVWHLCVSPNQSKLECNFGNGYFGSTQISSAGTNASGNGIFEYDVPTGYTALSTKGLNL